MSTEPHRPQTPEERYRASFPHRDTADITSKQSRAYETALDIRKFEIELYWKRAAYFWLFTGAALVAYLTALTGKDIVNRGEALLLTSCTGLVFATAWYLVNRASKYWQLNWEFHKVNQWLSFFEMVLFGALMVGTLIEYYQLPTKFQWFPTLCVVGTVIAMCVMTCFGRVSAFKAEVHARARTTIISAWRDNG